MKLSQIKINPAAEENGRWMDANGLYGVAVKVRGMNNSAARAARTKIQEGFARKKMSDAEAERAQVELIADTILIDWRGVENDDGTALICDREAKIAIMSNPEMRLFREAVLLAASLVGEDELAAKEQDAKN